MEVKFYSWLESDDIPYKEPNETWLDSVPDGWQDAFTLAMAKIGVILDKYHIPFEALTFLQVKEKFGALRIYWSLKAKCDDAHIEIDELIDALEKDTEKMCSCCGEPAEYLSKGWILPYCKKCATQQNNAANARHKTNIALDDAYRKINKD